MSDVYQDSVALHKKFQGKIEIHSRMPVTSKAELALAYSPGVAEPCRVIQKDPEAAYDLTLKGRTVAVISDGTAVLGLGDIGAVAGLPVMEGKALLLKEFGGVDAIPLVLNTKDAGEIIKIVTALSPTFAGINLEDISAPRCFEIEEALQEIGIPVFHDDQHGTAIVVTAALRNAAKVVGKRYEDLHVVIVGAGAAGLAVGKMLLGLECTSASCTRLVEIPAVADVILVDSKGAVAPQRTDLNSYKKAFSEFSNHAQKQGSLADVMAGADVVIGLSRPGLITTEMIQSMAAQPMVFALANPTPEIMPEAAKAAGAAVVATGRSDYPNQINNVLVFPGIFRAVIDGRLRKITMHMKLIAAESLAALVPEPTAELIVPDPFMPGLAEKLSQSILDQLK